MRFSHPAGSFSSSAIFPSAAPPQSCPALIGQQREADPPSFYYHWSDPFYLPAPSPRYWLEALSFRAQSAGNTPARDQGTDGGCGGSKVIGAHPLFPGSPRRTDYNPPPEPGVTRNGAKERRETFIRNWTKKESHSQAVTTFLKPHQGQNIAMPWGGRQEGPMGVRRSSWGSRRVL